VYSKILILRFPPIKVQKPLVCDLAKKFDLTFNILNATIFPRQEGLMVMELSGKRKNFKEGVQYLEDHGVNVKNASQGVRRSDRKCIHCGFCTAVCPTNALYVKRPEMSIEFDQKKCSLCELCISACPTRAMKTTATSDQAFF
jgi:L-aspartate semialdehyde sulfurtransferase ferredoxin